MLLVQPEIIMKSFHLKKHEFTVLQYDNRNRGHFSSTLQDYTSHKRDRFKTYTSREHLDNKTDWRQPWLKFTSGFAMLKPPLIAKTNSNHLFSQCECTQQHTLLWLTTQAMFYTLKKAMRHCNNKRLINISNVLGFFATNGHFFFFCLF